MMKVIFPILALLILCLGPGLGQQVPLPAGEADAAISFVSLDHQAESPARTLRLEQPQRSAIDPPAPVVRFSSEAFSSAQLGRPPLDLAPSPSLHLELCVFLC